MIKEHHPIDNGTRVSECRDCKVRMQLVKFDWIPDEHRWCTDSKPKEYTDEEKEAYFKYANFSHYGWFTDGGNNDDGN